MLIHALDEVLQRLNNAARHSGRPSPRLLAVSKRQPAAAIVELAAADGNGGAALKHRAGQTGGAAYTQEISASHRFGLYMIE